MKNNGFNPVWNQEFEFKIQIPALAFLDIKVKDLSQSGTDNDLGMFCCPLLTIQEGYRRVPLKSYARNQDLHPAALLLHIQVNHQWFNQTFAILIRIIFYILKILTSREKKNRHKFSIFQKCIIWFYFCHTAAEAAAFFKKSSQSIYKKTVLYLLLSPTVVV